MNVIGSPSSNSSIHHDHSQNYRSTTASQHDLRRRSSAGPKAAGFPLISVPPHSLLSLILLALVGQATGDRLTSTGAVKIALKQSPKLRAARAERDAALAHNDKEKPVARPSVSIEAVGQLQGPRVTLPRVTPGDETVVPERYGRLELLIEQTLFRAGLSSARARYDAQNRAADWELRRAEQETAVEVLRAYFGLVSAEDQAKIAGEGVRIARKQLDLTRTMLEAGTASERDVKASDADLAEAELGKSRAEGGVDLARANLNRLMGLDPAASVEMAPVSPLPAIPSSSTDPISQAMRDRPEIHLLDEGLAAARASESLAATQNLPTLSARAIGAAQTPTALTDSKFFAAGLSLKWSPFDQGKTRSDVREARASVARLEALREDARLGIRLEVEKALTDMRTARDRIAVADRQVSSAEAALGVSQLRYQAGTATQLEVSGSLFALIKARGNRAQAETDLRLADAELRYAIGQAAPPESVVRQRQP